MIKFNKVEDVNNVYAAEICYLKNSKELITKIHRSHRFIWFDSGAIRLKTVGENDNNSATIEDSQLLEGVGTIMKPTYNQYSRYDLFYTHKEAVSFLATEIAKPDSIVRLVSDICDASDELGNNIMLLYRLVELQVVGGTTTRQDKKINQLNRLIESIEAEIKDLEAQIEAYFYSLREPVTQ